MTGLLASVANLAEARLVQHFGVDVIDLKAPSAGALGALEIASVEEIVTQLDPDTLISATVGDLPLQPEILDSAVARMWATGVDYVKIGLFPGGDWRGSISLLKNRARAGARLIAVFFADCEPDIKWFDALAAAGFSGVMLDTRDKSLGSLRRIMPAQSLEGFVMNARAHGFICGLAGSLRLEDIESLAALGPDYLGFRGALCRGGSRIDELDREALYAIRKKISATQKSRIDPVRSVLSRAAARFEF